VLVRRNVRDLAFAFPNLNSATVHKLSRLIAGRPIIGARYDPWLALNLICIVYTEKAVLNHYACLQTTFLG
jgi:hypothetical protein